MDIQEEEIKHVQQNVKTFLVRLGNHPNKGELLTALDSAARTFLYYLKETKKDLERQKFSK